MLCWAMLFYSAKQFLHSVSTKIFFSGTLVSCTNVIDKQLFLPISFRFHVIIWVNAMVGYAFLQCKYYGQTNSTFSQHKNLLFRYACFLYKCYRQTAVFTNKFQISCNYLGQCYGGLCFFTVQNNFFIPIARKSFFQVRLFPVQMLSLEETRC